MQGHFLSALVLVLVVAMAAPSLCLPGLWGPSRTPSAAGSVASTSAARTSAALAAERSLGRQASIRAADASPVQPTNLQQTMNARQKFFSNRRNQAILIGGATTLAAGAIVGGVVGATAGGNDDSSNYGSSWQSIANAPSSVSTSLGGGGPMTGGVWQGVVANGFSTPVSAISANSTQAPGNVTMQPAALVTPPGNGTSYNATNTTTTIPAPNASTASLQSVPQVALLAVPQGDSSNGQVQMVAVPC